VKFHESAPTIIYKYGVYKIVEGQQEVDDQFRLAHRYRNRLVEIDREKRGAVIARLMENEEYREIAERVQAREEEIKKIKSRNPEENGQQDEKKGVLKELYKSQRADRTAMRKIAKESQSDERIQEIYRAANVEKKAARATCGCYHSTYITVEAEAMASAASTPYDAMPRFMRWGESQRLAVQLVNGEPPSVLFEGNDRRIRIAREKRGYTRHPEKTRVRFNTGRLATLWFRVRSENRRPIWALIEFIYHRPLPDDCLVKWVYLLRRRIGRRWKYELLFALARPNGSWEKPDRATSGAVAVDIGWRQTDEGIRVGYWVGSDGEEGEIRLRPDLASEEGRTYSLRSIRDNLFNEMRERLQQWLADNKACLTDELRDLCKTIAQWQSHLRLISWIMKWRQWTAGFAGNLPPKVRELDGALTAWLKKETHLWDWEANLRDQLVNYRRDAFNKAAAMLRRRYRRLILTDLDLRRLARRSASEPDDLLPSARTHRQQVAAGAFRLTLKQHFNGDVILVQHELVNAKHHACGYEGGRSDPKVLTQVCDGCGKKYDQDQNAARNMLELAAGSLTNQVVNI
jgi:hypothetical protein